MPPIPAAPAPAGGAPRDAAGAARREAVRAWNGARDLDEIPARVWARWRGAALARDLRRRAERAASRLLQVFSATTCFLRELRRGLRQTQPETAPVPEAPTAGGPAASSSAPIVSSAILMCWSVVLLRFGHTKTAGAFAAAGGVVAWVALLARRV